MSTWLLKQLSRFGLGGKEFEDLAQEAMPPQVPLSVLLVDDTPENLQVLMETLKPLGHKLLAAKCGEQALKIARRSRPALILLDVMMPEMDGFEVCRQLKADSDLARSAVIFCSALDDIESKVKGLNAGAVDFITKPFEPEEVVARVSTHLTVQQLAHSLSIKNASLLRELAVAGAENQTRSNDFNGCCMVPVERSRIFGRPLISLRPTPIRCCYVVRQIGVQRLLLEQFTPVAQGVTVLLLYVALRK